MKPREALATCGAGLLTLFFGVAQAVPVTFEFSGRTFSTSAGNPYSVSGEIASGSISFETEGLVRTETLVGP